jgi:hypothetical protein
MRTSWELGRESLFRIPHSRNRPLEPGTDLRYIQVLLDHNCSKTTEIYTHLTIKSLQNILIPWIICGFWYIC